VYLYQIFFPDEAAVVQVCAWPVLQMYGDRDGALHVSPVWQWQWLRIWASAFSHLGLLHIAMNMMTVFYMSNRRERKLGSLPFAGMIVLLVWVSGWLYVTIDYVIVLVHPSWSRCAVGFSGVLFALIMAESLLVAASEAGAMRSVFGFFRVPVWAYPWILLVLLQLLMPKISLLGHLSGILVGFAYAKGMLRFATPRRSWVRAMDNSRLLKWLAVSTSPVYVKMPASSASGLNADTSEFESGGVHFAFTRQYCSCNLCPTRATRACSGCATWCTSRLAACAAAAMALLPSRSSSSNINNNAGSGHDVARRRGGRSQYQRVELGVLGDDDDDDDDDKDLHDDDRDDGHDEIKLQLDGDDDDDGGGNNSAAMAKLNAGTAFFFF
jgi:membrane associated rhomboid family serine protease